MSFDLGRVPLVAMLSLSWSSGLQVDIRRLRLLLWLDEGNSDALTKILGYRNLRGGLAPPGDPPWGATDGVYWG